MTRIPGVDDAVVERAKLTRRQAECLALWDPSPHKSAGGYGSVALALGLDRATVRDHVQRGLRKLEQALQEPEVVREPEPVVVGPDPGVERVRTREAVSGVQVFAE